MLTLPIKRRWYRMILNREKQEEYRADTPYYAARFSKYEGTPIRIRLRNGYGAGKPTLQVLAIPRRRRGAKPEWGGNPNQIYWVLEIQDILSIWGEIPKE